MKRICLILVIIMTAVLKITDGTTEIDLLGSYGYVLNNWRPATADYKGGGVWRSSSIAEGRRLVDKKWANAIETFELKATRASQDALIRETQDLRRMLEDAADYWVNDFNNTPVYIETQATNETNVRYAVVHRGRIAEDDNPFSQPFLQADCSAAMDRLTLVVERGHWGENVPGEGTCVQLSAEQDWEYTQMNFSKAVVASFDDCFVTVHPIAPIIDLAANEVRFGTSAAGYDEHAGLRFTNVTIPQGSEILSAYVQFEAFANGAGAGCFVSIYGNDVNDAATFSTFQDFMDRVLTDAVVWYPTSTGSGGIEDWTAGNSYNTPDIRTIIQEIVNRGGWSSGNDLALIFRNNDSTAGQIREADSWNGRPTEPTLYVTYVTTQVVGRTATCEQEVYAANKNNIAQLSHIWRFDTSGPSYTDLMGVALPYDLLPNPVGNGDIIYFGINTALENSGPFASLVFDIGTRAIYTGDAGIAWEYYDGAWQTLDVQDNTRSPLGGTGSFSITGVNSVHWEQPDDWIPFAINGITAYWVRARVALSGDTITTPTQQNRHPYTITWAYLDIDEAQIPGDIEALARLKLFSEGDYRSGTPNLWANRVIVGRRAISRGEDFRAYINLADEQNHPGLEINAISAAAAFQTDTTAPAGRSILYTPTGVSDAWATRASIYFKDEDLIQQYRGVYRAFVRAKQTGGDLTDDYVSVRLGTQMPGDNIRVISDELQFTKVGYIQALDLGEITIPLDGSPAGIDFEWYFATNFHIQANSSAAWSAATLTLYDFIVLPADEWLGEFTDPTDFIDFGSALGTAGAGWMRHIDIDSISHPKRHISALIYQKSIRDPSDPKTGTDRALLSWQQRAQGSMVAQENVDQRFWIFADQHATFSDDPFISPPYHGYSAQAFRNAQYLSMRGDR